MSTRQYQIYREKFGNLMSLEAGINRDVKDRQDEIGSGLGVFVGEVFS